VLHCQEKNLGNAAPTSIANSSYVLNSHVH
jgi:hypothetical protein